jgi:hypothetical protein
MKHSMPKIQPAVVGLRAKTGRAIAVALAGLRGAPLAIERTELVLWSPKTPATFQPYHAVLDLPWDQADRAARETEAIIAELATTALGQLIDEIKALGFKVQRVAVVGAPDRRLESIGNRHIRAHAAEGVLYRRVLETAAEANSLRSLRLVEKDLFARACAELGISDADFAAHLASIGGALGRPWRTDEKLATVAAWLGLDASFT